MTMSVHYSSDKHDWTTPKWLFDALDNYYDFGLDAAASDENHLCDDYFTEEDDSLIQDWRGYGNVWVNPPYGRLGHQFVAKAFEQAQNDVTTAMLIPARTDTASWHNYIFGQDNVQVRFLRGRLKFGGAKDPAPFPSALILFGAGADEDLWDIDLGGK